ncbi:MAG: LysR family transcriptional regulator [Propionivibrio sp.]|uniref:LysR family transcriptional regulator n=1 Tax=Propionivibrio sp. TaxID=2212460 RepID=UPI001B3E451C|nr:LysR family transcriptional regulator [Propionivibrio sp.]MBP7203532.1 LysR family transcriptional regulator [Propionivibrio sp.]
MDRLLSMRVFQKVIDEGGFAAAARALDMSPAVVTRLVADLENHLGTRLLHRTTRRVSLSPAGENYLNRVRGILQDIDEAHSIASAQTSEPKGVLRVLTPPVLATFLLAPLIAEFRALHPKIRLHVEVDSHEDLPIEDYDVTLLPTNDAFDADIVARKVSDTEAILVCSPEYIRRHGTPATPTDLAQHELLRLRAQGMVQRVWRLRNSHSDEVFELVAEPSLWINHTETLLRATVDGAGITSVAVALAAPHLARGELVRVLHPWITDRLRLYVALPSRKFMPERTRVFLEFIIDRIREQNAEVQYACDHC